MIWNSVPPSLSPEIQPLDGHSLRETTQQPKKNRNSPNPFRRKRCPQPSRPPPHRRRLLCMTNWKDDFYKERCWHLAGCWAPSLTFLTPRTGRCPSLRHLCLQGPPPAQEKSRHFPANKHSSQPLHFPFLCPSGGSVRRGKSLGAKTDPEASLHSFSERRRAGRYLNPATPGI